jgi:AcrR family transcriptional regulator
MSESAIVRSGKRQLMAQRITTTAQLLVLEHGLDGFTMEQLAEQVGVSRRTLFNYFPGKDDAILGGPPVIDDDMLEAFTAGGPTGNLVEDLAALVLAVLDDNPGTREDVARGRQVMRSNPRLIAFAHERLQECVESSMVFIEKREGSAFDRSRVDVAIALVIVCVHLAMDRYLDDDVESELSSLFTESLGTARDLLT